MLGTLYCCHGCDLAHAGLYDPDGYHSTLCDRRAVGRGERNLRDDNSTACFRSVIDDLRDATARLEEATARLNERTAVMDWLNRQPWYRFLWLSMCRPETQRRAMLRLNAAGRPR
ncbi:MAG TPA: hypothetical protein VJX66_31950 [Amycolatopsis sp.]|nr:hypothetical protein [Amycolatopsis sp.]